MVSQKETLYNLPPFRKVLARHFTNLIWKICFTMFWSNCVFELNRLEVLQPLVRNILTLIVSVDLVEDQTSISNTEKMPSLAVVSMLKREDITGLPKPREETPQELEEWELSDTFIDSKRMVTDPELKLPKRFPSEQWIQINQFVAHTE